MPPLSRLTSDMTTGCTSGGVPVPFDLNGTTKVYCNNMLCCVFGCQHKQHGCSDPKAQTPIITLLKSSQTVMLENKGAGRIGDAASCGECLANGSGNVMVGD